MYFRKYIIRILIVKNCRVAEFCKSCYHGFDISYSAGVVRNKQKERNRDITVVLSTANTPVYSALIEARERGEVYMFVPVGRIVIKRRK